MKIRSLELATAISVMLGLVKPMQGYASESVDAVVAENETEMAKSTTKQSFPEQGLWTANIKRMGLEYMEHSVTNKEDPNYPDTYNAE